MAESQRARPRLRDRFAASDPGLLRLRAALRTVGAVGLTLAVVALLQFSVTDMVAGAITAMVATFAIKEQRVRDQGVTLALGLPVALAALALGALLNSRVVTGDLFFLLLIFSAVYARRFGDRGTALGLIGFQVYFVSLFVHARPHDLPGLCVTVLTGFVCSAVMRFAVVPDTPERTLDRLRRAFRARLARLVATQIELLDAEPDGLDSVLDDLRRHTARLHEAALMIQGRLDEGTRDETAAALVQRRVADPEIAAERLGLLLIGLRSAERDDTLTLHLPHAPLPEPATRPVAEEDITRRLRRDLEGLHLLIARADGRGTALHVVRNRLLGYRDEGNLPDAPPAVQDVFRALGEAARAVLGLRMALDGLEDESDDSQETARSREELDAEDIALGSTVETEEQDAAAERRTGLQRRTTRAAFQVAIGSALAIVGGEFLSSQRWYWAVITCWVVFLNTSSTGEILVKGYRRLLGTTLGVVAGLGLAALVGHNTWIAFAIVLLCIFGMFYTAPLSYALTSFFLTAMLGVLYLLLHTYSLSVLVLRIEETALGLVCGFLAAFVVLPVRTDLRTDELLRTVLLRLRDVTSAALDQLSGGPPADLLELARDLDTALDDLRRSTLPLTHPITPLRERRRTARYLVALLETCAYHARALAATAELVPHSKRVAADPRLKRAGRRILANIDLLVVRLEDDKVPGEIQAGASIASMLAGPEGHGSEAVRSGTVTFRVLRHLQRLDESVVGLARPLGVPVSDGGGKDASQPRSQSAA